jgi:ribosomal protein L11 methylase PrmA
MIDAVADLGSFRDPGGRIFLAGDRVLRAVMAPSAAAYESARDSGLLQHLAERALLLPSEEVDRKSLAGLCPDARYVLEHPRIPLISYPYEWSFSLHRRAALHHLDVHLAALEESFTLSDSTAYNIQFQGTRPVFIDHLSLIPYRDGDIWMGHRQFCMQFLNPLIFWAVLGVQPNHWFRGSLEGIAPEDLSPLLSWRDNLSWTIITHVTAQAALQSRALRRGTIAGKPSERKLPKSALTGMLQGLRRYIEGLKLPGKATVWGEYAENTSYADDEQAAKHRFVGTMVEATKPNLLFDIGCNTGDYSLSAFDAGAKNVIGFDFDHHALDRAFQRFDSGKHSFLPLWLDAANPSPSQGWAQAERKGMAERASADALIALAFIHHIAIGRNVPLDMAVDWLMSLAPAGVIEFPPKSDPMVQRLLAQREDIFPDYHDEAFLHHVQQRGRIRAQQRVSEGGRLLVWYERE